MNIGQMFGIALRTINHRSDLERIWAQAAERRVRELLDFASQAHDVANKIVPGLLAGDQTAGQEQKYDVRWLQMSLNTLINARLTVDGIYGPLTQNAVREFQRQHGLVEDGWAGIATESKIVELLGKR